MPVIPLFPRRRHERTPFPVPIDAARFPLDGRSGERRGGRSVGDGPRRGRRQAVLDDPRQRQMDLYARRRLGQTAGRDAIRLRLRPRGRFAGPRLRHVALGQSLRRHLRQSGHTARNVEQAVRRRDRLFAGAGQSHRPRPLLEQGRRHGISLLDGKRRRRRQGFAEDRRPRLQDRHEGQSSLHHRQRGKDVVHVAEV